MVKPGVVAGVVLVGAGGLAVVFRNQIQDRFFPPEGVRGDVARITNVLGNAIEGGIQFVVDFKIERQREQPEIVGIIMQTKNRIGQVLDLQIAELVPAIGTQIFPTRHIFTNFSIPPAEGATVEFALVKLPEIIFISPTRMITVRPR